MDSLLNFKNKYIKYKNKYIKYKNFIGGNNNLKDDIKIIINLKEYNALLENDKKNDKENDRENNSDKYRINPFAIIINKRDNEKKK